MGGITRHLSIVEAPSPHKLIEELDTNERQYKHYHYHFKITEFSCTIIFYLEDIYCFKIVPNGGSYRTL